VSVTLPNQRVSGFEGSPIIAIEIVSAGNSAEEIDRKTEAYLEEGAAEVWIVYPGTRTVKVFRKDGAIIRVIGVYDCALIGLQVDLCKILLAVKQQA
jgi:Uma2 family endonuclease